MQVPLDITTQNVSLNPRDESLIEKRAAKLDRFYDRVTGCRVVIEGPGDHHRSGGPYKVRIHLAVPGNELTVDRQTGDDLTASIHAAFDAITRQLRDYARTRRGEVKSHGDAGRVDD